jgi:hypothetical protein
MRLDRMIPSEVHGQTLKAPFPLTCAVDKVHFVV